MSKAVLVLLERARQRRALAERARRLAGGITADADVDKLGRYAADLEQSAQEFEARASALIDAAAGTQAPSAVTAALVEEAFMRLAAMRPKTV